jgi:predicted TIM-barrel fold metal-dependent hydrolase
VSDNPGYNLISADSHVVEPADLFEKRVPAGVRDRAPKLVAWNGGSAWQVEDVEPVPFVASTVTGSGYRRPRGDGKSAVAFDDLMPSLHDPAERLKTQDADGVSAEVLYGYPGLWDAIKLVDDAEIRLACAQAYNDWLAEFCAHDPLRLIGVGRIPTSSIADARKEVVRCIEELNLRGLVVDAWPDDCSGATDANLDQIWEVVNDARIPISLHYGVGASPSAPAPGVAPGSPPPMWEGATRMVGAFERFPDLRMVFAHGNAGWAFHWMEVFDGVYLRQKHLDIYKMPRENVFPSEYVRRHYWFTFQHDHTAVRNRRLLGDGHLMWASHFPLDASNWPDNRQDAMLMVDELPTDDQRALLAENVARLYRLPGYETGIDLTPFEEIEVLVHV